MAKRFTDTDKWKKPFVKSLKGTYKLFWLYLLDDCDHAGIWQVDVDVAQIRIGDEIDLYQALKLFGDKVTVFNNGEKWFIPDFIEFQYGDLNPQNRAHNSVLTLLNKYNLLPKNKPLTSPLQGAKDKDMDKDMDKDKDKEVGESEKKFTPPTEEEVMDYFEQNNFSRELGSRVWRGYNESKWSDSKGSKIKNWKLKCQHVWFNDSNRVATQPHEQVKPISKSQQEIVNGYLNKQRKPKSIFD